jgi:hypothetical protein
LRAVVVAAVLAISCGGKSPLPLAPPPAMDAGESGWGSPSPTPADDLGSASDGAIAPTMTDDGGAGGSGATCVQDTDCATDYICGKSGTCGEGCVLRPANCYNGYVCDPTTGRCHL